MSLTPEELGLIGGSDAAAIAGVSRYRAPIDVYRRIVEHAEAPQTKAMERGTLLEPVIREMYRRETHAELLGPRSLRSEKFPFARASLDDVARFGGEERVAEFKSASLRTISTYGTEADGVPEEYLCQVNWYMAMAQLPVADLAVLLAGDELRVYTIEADAEVQGMLFDAAARFWTDHVLTRTPPPPDDSEPYARYLAARFPHSKGNMLTADAEAERWAQQLLSARRAAAAAENAEREARNHLVALIGEADGIEGANWRVTYRSNKGRATVDWQAVAFEAKVPKTLVEQYTTRKPFRRFCVSGEGVADEQ